MARASASSYRTRPRLSLSQPFARSKGLETIQQINEGQYLLGRYGRRAIDPVSEDPRWNVEALGDFQRTYAVDRNTEEMYASSGHDRVLRAIFAGQSY